MDSAHDIDRNDVQPDNQGDFQDGGEAHAADDSPGYYGPLGDWTLPTAMGRALAMARRRRVETFDWLVGVLTQNTGCERSLAVAAVDAAIPTGQEAMFDEPSAFLPAMQSAAIALGLDPERALVLHPVATH